jgi:Tfp pilus assembly protein PilE
MYSRARRAIKYTGCRKHKKMKKGFALIEWTIVVAFIALSGLIGIPKLIAANIANNEAEAQKTLKIISIACENYGKANKGVYPRELSALTQRTPKYLNVDYTLSPTSGYAYNFSSTDTGYTVNAKPLKAGVTGSRVFTITTGGVLTSVACGEE